LKRFYTLIIFLLSFTGSVFSTDGPHAGQVFVSSIHSFRTELTVTSVQSPNGFYLGQNFPNPFNPVTDIYFSVPKSQNIRITVTDVLGKEIGVITQGFTAAGSYKANFDASGLSSGIYFYKFESNEFSEVKKMTLVK
jgi:hypothetical protein